MSPTEDWLAERFEERRGRLRAVAYRMLGSLSDADDAVQEAWQRLSRSDAEEIEHLDGWLVTVVGRVCLNMLRSRSRRREDPYGVTVPDPILTEDGANPPEDEALLAESVGLALLVVIETLTPAERLALVLHDMFGVSFDDVAEILNRSPAAVRQLASRARRRVRGEANVTDADLAGQREVVEAFFAAAREGDFDRLAAVLDPDVLVLSDPGAGMPAQVMRGADTVAKASVFGAQSGRELRRALVNGSPGGVLLDGGEPVALMAFTVARGRIVDIDVISDRERLRRIVMSGG
jgi:RNA polymerase sigma factor (sigma-70 family)